MRRSSLILFGPYVIGLLVLWTVLTGCDKNSRPAPPVAHHTVVTALIWAPDWPEQMLQIADQFNQKNPDITVNVQFMIGNSVEQNIKPRVASGNLPDLVSVNPNSYASALAEQGVLVDLDHTAAWDQLLDSLKPDWTSPSRHHFGISGGIATTLIYYNKALFARAGITRLPTNFVELLKVCEQLKRAGVVPVVWNGGFPNMLGNGPFSFGFANNVAASDPDWKRKLANGELDLNTAQVADIFDKIRIFADLGYVQDGYMNTSYDEAIGLFVDGKTAMAFQGSWASGLLMKGKGFETGVFIPPWNAPGKPVVPVIGSETGFAVCNTPNQVAALRFLEFVSDQGFAVLQNRRHNISPFKNNAALMRADPQIAAYTELVRSYPVSVGLYYSFLPANTIEILHPLMQNVLTHKISPRQAAREFDASVRHESAMHYK